MNQPTVNLGALPAVGVEVLESLHQHRLLTARQVHVLHMPANSVRWTRHVLAGLGERGLSERVTGPRGTALWFLTKRGAETIHAAGTLAEPRLRIATPAEASGPLRRHTLAVNDTGIAFVKAARERSEDDCGPLSWRHEIAHPIAPASRRQAQLVIADALLSYLQAAPDESLILHQRFIELDRGTIPPEQLAGKLARYAKLRHYRPKPAPQGSPDGPLWRTYYRVFPAVLIVLADQTPTAARRRIQRVIALHRSDPSQGRYGTVPASFVTLADLAARGPFAAIFIPAEQPDHFTDWLGNTHQHQPKGKHDVPA
jgi:Replication-relaxation